MESSEKKHGGLRGTIFKNQINHLITPAQAFGHKIPDLETSSRILRNWATKMMSFWKKLIIDNLVCIKTYSASSLSKPLDDQKRKSQDRDTLKSSLIDVLGHVDQKLSIFREHFWAIILSLDRNDINNFGPKGQPSKTILTLRRDASTWKAIYGMRRYPK